MDLKTFLKEHPILKKSVLARAMFPNVKESPSMLNQKLTGASVGTGKQRVTPEDARKAQEALDKLAESIRTNRIEP